MSLEAGSTTCKEGSSPDSNQTSSLLDVFPHKHCKQDFMVFFKTA